ncbi:MAG: HAD family phosphatase [Parcubacteria group bacterium]|nr:HAD family phosphatase [Parcubacteria group bacterium]
MEKKFQWIFFDLDGTLVDSVPAMYRIYLNFLETFGKIGTKEEFLELNGPALPEIISLLKKRYHLKDSEQSLMTLYKEAIARDYGPSLEPVDGAEETLKALQDNGYALALVTSAFRSMATPFMKERHWERYFKHCIFGDEVAQSKPNPDIYLLALKKTNAARETAAAVEDSPNGILSAKGAGIFTLGFTHSYPKKWLLAAGADGIIDNLKEIETIVKH